MIATNYTVRWRHFLYPEVGLARGIVQNVVFLPIVLYSRLSNKKREKPPSNGRLGSASILYLMGYGLFVGCASAACTSAIHMMPIGKC